MKILIEMNTEFIHFHQLQTEETIHKQIYI